MALSIAQDYLGVIFVKDVQVDFTAVRITSSMGLVTASISPALPNGLSLSVVSGNVKITGKPTVDVNMADYVITVNDQS